MQVPDVKEPRKYKINEVTIGATADQGGTRGKTVTIGGETSLTYLSFEGAFPHPPVIAVEVFDIAPDDWPPQLAKPYEDVFGDPAAWAAKAVQEYGADLICLRLMGTHPDFGDRSPDEAAKTVEAVLKAVDVPLIIRGSGADEKDNQVIPVCSHAAAGENCVLGSAIQENYKTIAASCIADKHKLICESPIDINIAKQVNILVSQMGFPLEDIIIDPTVGGLGYGIEYTYSILERMRLAAFGGDKLMAMPVFGNVGHEAWRAKEARAGADESPEWGDEQIRGAQWETMTATTLISVGADLIVMRHPDAIKTVRQFIEETWPKASSEAA